MSVVGMLDWGIGGLGCYRLFKATCPQVPVIYWSDTGAVPYGRLSARALAARVQAVLMRLTGLGATHILIACNAAATTLDAIDCTVPTLGVISASKHAVPERLRGTLGVIGGGRTVRSGAHRRLLQRSGLRVRGRVAQPLSGHIEAGRTRSAAYRRDLEAILAPLRHVDALLLACTHYPAIRGDITALLGPRVLLLDPAEALIEQVTRRFSLKPQSGVSDRFLTTGSPGDMRRAAQRAWNLTLPRCSRVVL